MPSWVETQPSSGGSAIVRKPLLRLFQVLGLMPFAKSPLGRYELYLPALAWGVFSSLVLLALNLFFMIPLIRVYSRGVINFILIFDILKFTLINFAFFLHVLQYKRNIDILNTLDTLVDRGHGQKTEVKGRWQNIKKLIDIKALLLLGTVWDIAEWGIYHFSVEEEEDYGLGHILLAVLDFTMMKVRLAAFVWTLDRMFALLAGSLDLPVANLVHGPFPKAILLRNLRLLQYKILQVEWLVREVLSTLAWQLMMLLMTSMFTIILETPILTYTLLGQNIWRIMLTGPFCSICFLITAYNAPSHLKKKRVELLHCLQEVAFFIEDSQVFEQVASFMITYTVILVQTGGQVESKVLHSTAAAPHNTTTE